MCAKFDSKVYLPPPDEREVWHYSKAKIDHIKKTGKGFYWDKAFYRIDGIQVSYILHETG